MKSKPFLAAYPGECAECMGEFDIGDEIQYDDDDEIIGVECCGGSDYQGGIVINGEPE